jgi:hypothetical protein
MSITVLKEKGNSNIPGEVIGLSIACFEASAAWAFQSLKGTEMKKLDLGYFCKLGMCFELLADLRNRDNKTVADIYIDKAKDFFSDLLRSYELPTSLSRGLELLVKIKAYQEISNPSDDETPQIMSEWRDALSEVLLAADRYQKLLFDELSSLNSYLVTRKGIYDSTTLIIAAEQAFSTQVLNKLPEEAIKDIQEGGKCLAFECNTASAFHILRAAETVLDRYFQMFVCPPKPGDKGYPKNWYDYICMLRSYIKSNPNDSIEQTLNLLDKIRSLERNLIMHPDIFLDEDAAMKVLSLTKSAIILMAEELRGRR